MTQKAANMIGNKIGKLKIIARDHNPPKKDRNSWWVCECECGNIKSYPRAWLISKRGIRSCGCSQHEHKVKYRELNKEEYQTWKDMKSRCLNPNRSGYKNYGGRGIKICDKWLNSFDSFFLDMGKKPFSGAMIERIDNDGDYEPNNCKWASRVEQNRNRRYNVIQSKQDADKIRDQYKTGNYTQLDLAKMWNVDEPIIWQIINNYSWV